MTSRTFQRRTAVRLALAAALFVTACGSDDGGSSPNTTGSSDTTDATETGDFDRDATLRFASDFDATSLDPLLSASSFDNVALFPIYDRLVHVDPDTAEPIPGLATSWSFSDDGLELEMELRDGVTFHDDTPFDAEAVKANFDRLLSMPESQAATEAPVVESVEVVDPLTVVIHLTEPAVYLPTILAGRAGMMVSPAAFEDPDLGTTGAGTGMYRNVEYRQGDRLVYERNENYWDPDAVGAARLELHVFPDSGVLLNAVSTGEVDFAPIQPQELSGAESAGLQVLSGESLNIWVMPLDRSHPALAETAVRQALSHAIDREGIAASIFNEAAVPAGQVFPESSPFFGSEAGTTPYPYDVEAARQLLADAGYADGFEMTLGVIADPLLQSIGEAVQAQLGEIGVTVNIESVDGSQFRTAWTAGQFHSIVSNPGAATVEPSQILSWVVGEDGPYNPAQVPTSDELVAMLDEVAAITDQDERAAAVQALADAVSAEALILPLVFPTEYMVAGESVVGARVWRSNQLEFRGVGIRS